jgi:hypothetical protein
MKKTDEVIVGYLNREQIQAFGAREKLPTSTFEKLTT